MDSLACWPTARLRHAFPACAFSRSRWRCRVVFSRCAQPSDRISGTVSRMRIVFFPGARVALTLALIFGAAGVVALRAQVPTSPPVVKRDSVSTATIAGVVVDSLGRAVAGATVRVVSGSPSTITDAQGQFRLTRVPAGDARVQVTGDGYTPLGFEFVIAANVTVSLKLTLLPAPPGSRVTAPVFTPVEASAVTSGPADTVKTPAGQTGIAGRVVDTAGKPPDSQGCANRLSCEMTGRVERATVPSPSLPPSRLPTPQ